MKQKIGVIFIFVIAIALLVVSFSFAINYNKGDKNYFYDSGYILSNNYESGSNNVNKLYFDESTSYKTSKNNEFTFTNTEGEKVNVNEESFVHYSNGAIMSLKKGVALDLNEIDGKIIRYYNIFEGSILTRKGEKYEIDNLDNKISFSKLMFKISKEKYLIASPKIVISFSDNQTVEMEDYVEIEYVSENVIRIYNDKVNYQTIASNLYAIIDDIKIDLEYKTISKNKVEYLTMADMVINSNDNIEVLPKPKEPKPEKEETNNQTNNSNNSNNSNNLNGSNNQGNQNVDNSGNTGNQVDSNLQQGLDNILGNLPDENEQVDTEDNFIQPKFSVDSMDVTTLGFENLKLSVVDESSVLYGARTVQILENSTGKVVQQFDNWEEGSLDYVVNSYFSLKPNTEYTLNVIGQYKIDDTIFDRTFISKIFRTLDIGLEIIEDYRTPDSLSFGIYRNTYSEVNGFTYNITDKDGQILVADTDVAFDDKDVIIISEVEKFKPNTKYVLNIKDIKYGNDVFATVAYEQMKLTYETKTLKETPFKKTKKDQDEIKEETDTKAENNVISLNAKVDSRSNTITFSVDGINDLYGGIKSYTYNIYSRNGELLHSITRENSKQLTLDFENLKSAEGVYYDIYYNVEINFDDNEKTIIFVSGNSELISISGIEYPKVVEFIPIEDNEDCEILYGEVLIDDASDFIATNNVSYYKIDIKENSSSSLTGTQQIVDSFEIEYENQEKRFKLPVYNKGLKPNTEYVMYVYLMVEDKYVYLGYTISTTLAPEPIYLHIEDTTKSDVEDRIFDFKIKKDVSKPTTSVSKLKQITIDLYGCGKENGLCEKLPYSTSIPKTQDSLELVDMMANEKTIDIYSNYFNFSLAEYNNAYDYKVKLVGHALNYEIPIKINDTDTDEFAIVFNDIDPYVKITSTPVKNLDFGEEIDKTLNDETIVGFDFKIERKPNVMLQEIKRIRYSIFENDSEKTCEELTDEEVKTLTPVIENQEINSFDKNVFIPVSNKEENGTLRRGINYCFKYNGIYTEEDKLTKTKSIDLMAKKQRVEVTGYIKEYENNKLSLKLEIVDPDKALVEESLNISNGSDIFAPLDHNPTDGIYVFSNILYDASYVVNLSEKIGLSEQKHKIYEFKLDEIVNYNENINVIADGSISGELTLRIPYNSSNDILEETDQVTGIPGFGQEEISIQNPNINVDRIAGLRIEYNNNISDFDLKKNEKELYVKLSLNDVSKFGKIVDGTLELGTISVIYDSGKIIDYEGKEKLAFIKPSISEETNKYFTKNSEFKSISLNSIFNTKILDSIVLENKFPTKEGMGLKNEIGLSVFGSNGKATSVKLNETEGATPNLYDFAGNPILDNKVSVKEALTTSKLETVSTSTGATVKFNIKSNVVNNTKLQVKLNQLETVEIEYVNGKWSDYANNNGRIKEISVEGKAVTIIFNNIADAVDYKYSIFYKIEESESKETYNEDTNSLNKDIEVSSLKELYIIQKSAEYKITYWNWNEDNKDINNIVKKIISQFEVDSSRYSLSTGESIKYNIVAKQNLEEEGIKLLEGQSLAQSDSENKISSNVTEYNVKIDNKFNENTELKGEYHIFVEPKLVTEKGEIALSSIKLDAINILHKDNDNAFEFNVTNGGVPTFNVKAIDHAGMFTVCDSSIFEQKENEINTLNNILNKKPMSYVVNDKYINGYFEQKREKSKVVYFELYSKDGDEYLYRGYTPIPFATKTSTLDLSEFFTTNSLPSAEYKVRINYCAGDGTDFRYWESTNFSIINTSTINIEVVDAQDAFLLMLNNPDPVFKDSIKRIRYQLTNIDGTTTIRELNNINDASSNFDDFQFTTVKMNGSTVYFVALSTGGKITSTIKGVTVNLYSSATDDSLLYTYEYINDNKG